MFNLLWPLMAFSGEPIHEIEVVAHEDIEVYVAPTEIKNESKKFKASIGEYSIFGYTSQYKNLAKVQGKYGWTTIDYSDKSLKIFNKDTIKHVWEDCDYDKSPKSCSYENSHYLLESHITVNENQIVLEIFLYDSDLQIISSAREASTITINWIRQQSTQVNMSSGILQNNTTISNEKEELPLRWDIPPQLLNKHVQQCSLRLWSSVKFKL